MNLSALMQVFKILIIKDLNRLGFKRWSWKNLAFVQLGDKKGEEIKLPPD